MTDSTASLEPERTVPRMASALAMLMSKTLLTASKNLLATSLHCLRGQTIRGVSRLTSLQDERLGRAGVAQDGRTRAALVRLRGSMGLFAG